MKRISIILLILCGTLSFAAERPSEDFVRLLDICLNRENVTPDSIYESIEVLERHRSSLTEAGPRAVVTAALARLYSERSFLAQTYSRETASHPDSLRQWTVQEWQQRSLQLFREAMQNLDVLHFESTRNWLPLVSRGKDESAFGSSMLYVVWHAVQTSLPRDMVEREPLFAMQRLVDYYKERGLDDAVVWLESERKMEFPPSNNPIMVGTMGMDIYPGRPVNIALQLRNMQEVSARVYAVNDTLGMDDEDFLKKVLKTGKPVYNTRYSLAERADTVEWADTMSVGGLSMGHYAVVLEGKTRARLAKKPDPVAIEFWVRRQKAFALSMPDGKMRLWMVDAMSGAPMDALEWDTAGIGRYYQPSAIDTVVKRGLKIYTDRPVYRPGQTVHIGGIAYDTKVWDATAVENRTITLRILDADQKEVSKETVFSDDFGVFSYDFVIPEGCRTGVFRIISTQWSDWRTFRVEEYKRPEFFITMDEVNDGADMQPGKQTEIVVSGQLMRYNGVPLSGARVTATAERGYCWREYDRKEMTLDTLLSDSEGRFSYTIKADTTFSEEWRRYSRLHVNITALSPTGEMQNARSSYRLFVDPPQPETMNPWARKIPGEIHLFHTLVAENKLLKDTVYVMKDSIYLPQIPYEERFGQRAVATFMYVKEGSLYTKNVYVDKPMPQDSLEYRWETFRDRVQPGGKETWTLKVTRKDGTPVHANLMATLYDASLDALATSVWDCRVARTYATPYMRMADWGVFDNHRHQYFSVMMQPWYTKVADKDFSNFNDLYFLPRYRRFYDRVHLLANVPVVRKPALATALYKSADTALTGKISGLQSNEDAEQEEEDGEMCLRQDFSESSFFEPRLRTDAEGRVQLSFTLPENLTTWHLKFLAHTKQMESVVGDEKIVAQKQLMAQLHLPRFVRYHDKLWVKASVINTSDKTGSGKATFILKGEHTGKTYMKKHVTFSLDSHRDTIYSFLIEAGNHEELICQFVADSEKYSDGEQRLIHVISPAETLVSSTALTLRPGEKKEVKLDALFPSDAVNKKVIVEKTVNPIWLALDALPHMALPATDNVIGLTQTFFAESLISQMPSLMPAADTLFRNRQVQYSREFCISKIASQQRPDGSFAWYSGMQPSVWVTSSVARILARLKMLDNGRGRDEAASQAETIYRKAEQWLKDKKVSVFRTPTRKDADSIISLLPHSDGFYLASPGGWQTSVDERIMRNVEALEIIEKIYPEKTELTHSIRSWILNQKRTEGWNNPMACVEAVYALLRHGDFSDLEYQRPYERDTVVAWGRPIAFQNDGKLDMWAAVYAQYDIPVDKVHENGTGLRVERSSNHGMHKVGEILPVRVVITADRNYEYVHLSVPRSSAVESRVKLSGLGYRDGLCFYREIHDSSTDYYIESLPQGTYVLEDEQIIVREGEVNNGVVKVECLYAPEFRAHTNNETMKIK